MKNLITFTAVITSNILFSVVFAQNPSVFGSTPAGTPGGASADTASTQVMSTDQFKSTVKSLSKQTDESIAQSVDDRVRAGAGKPITPPPSTLAPDQNSLSSGTSTTPTTTAPAPKPVAQPKPRPSAAAPAAQPAPTSTDTYTGFGGATQPSKNTGNTGNNQGSTGGGWNVGY